MLVRFNTARSIEYFLRYSPSTFLSPRDASSHKVLGSNRSFAFPERIVRDYETGRISDYEFYTSMSRGMSLACSYSEFFKGWNKMFIEPVDGIDGILKSLSKRYRLLALSNTSPSHIEYLTKKFGFFNYFLNLITSYELGFLKPDSRIYKKAEEKYFPREKPLLYIDDLHENVAAARKAGWPAYRFENTNKLKAILRDKYILR